MEYKFMKKYINFDLEDKLLNKMIQPYRFSVKLLSILLLISLIGNIYLTTKQVNIVFTANKNTESTIKQGK